VDGYKNRILRVNLSNRSFSEEPLSEALIHDYVGGRGFGAKLLYDDLKPGADPLGEDNEIILIAGPLAGTNAQAFSRWIAFFKSPLTGGYFRSVCGGHLAAELKFAGFDGIIIRGIADSPVYLWIHDGQYELRDATYLWGLNCSDTHTLIREDRHDPNIRIACIGPAGENKVRYAGIFSDRRAAGRGGGGAVMGAKKLKAIAVRGHEQVSLSRPEAFSKEVKAQVRANLAHPSYAVYSRRGRQNANLTNTLGMFPTRNFREGVLPGWESISTEAYGKLWVGRTACYKCMIRCGVLTKMEQGKYAGAWTEGPEYETIWVFTGPFLLTDIGLTIAADHLCDELGLDTISAGGTLGLCYELYERGIITSQDTGGLELTYGNGEPIPELLRRIAYRQDFGDLLAEGSRLAAHAIGKGSEQFAMQVKGLEMPGYDPRGAKAHGLSLLTSVIGASHMIGYAVQELVPGRYSPDQAIDRFAVPGKGEMCQWNQDHMAWREVGLECGGLTSDDNYARLLATATGIDDFADTGYLEQVGERIYNLERMFNAREGFDRKDDAFPSRFIHQTLTDGPSAGQVFEIEPLLTDYYNARGWDVNTGNPTAAKLEELGLGFARI